MEKVWECGLMLSRDARYGERKSGSGRESGQAGEAILEMIGQGELLLREQKSRADTRRHGRAISTS
jgi:hypothetical protein